MKNETLVNKVRNGLGNQSTRDIMKNIIFKNNQEAVKANELRKN